jgi:hypothetical protein
VLLFPSFREESTIFAYLKGLKRKIAAAVVSEFIGLGSVDYVLKRYLAGVTYREENGSRLDLRILWIGLWICEQLHSSIK